MKEVEELPEEQIRELDIKTIIEHLEKQKSRYVNIICIHFLFTVLFDYVKLNLTIDFTFIRLPSQIPNMQLIKEYMEKDALYIRRVKECEDITAHRNKLRNEYDDSRRRRTYEFLAGFSIITSKLKEMYQMITLGGDAELELVDSLDPFNEGIVFR